MPSRAHLGDLGFVSWFGVDLCGEPAGQRTSRRDQDEDSVEPGEELGSCFSQLPSVELQVGARHPSPDRIWCWAPVCATDAPAVKQSTLAAGRLLVGGRSSPALTGPLES